jgi:MFS family permease
VTGLAIGPAVAGLAAASGDVLQRRPGWRLAAALVAAGLIVLGVVVLARSPRCATARTNERGRMSEDG